MLINKIKGRKDLIDLYPSGQTHYAANVHHLLGDKRNHQPQAFDIMDLEALELFPFDYRKRE